MLTQRRLKTNWPRAVVRPPFYTLRLGGSAYTRRGVDYKAREPSSRFHSFDRESYWQHPMGFSLSKLQNSISLHPLSHSDLTSHGSTYGQGVSVNGYRSLSACKENLGFHNSRTDKDRNPKFCIQRDRVYSYKFQLPNRNHRYVVYTNFQLWKPISRKRLDLRSSNFVCKEMWLRA